MNNFDKKAGQKSYNVPHYVSRQICQHFNSNQHQFSWIQKKSEPNES